MLQYLYHASAFQRRHSPNLKIPCFPQYHKHQKLPSQANPSSPQLSSTIAELEALACLRVVQFAANLGLQRVIFKGDSTTIISAVSHGSSVMASFGNIIDDVRHLLPRFSFVSFNHIHRSGNVVVDALAKKASSIVGCHSWMDALPLDIAELVSFDVH